MANDCGFEMRVVGTPEGIQKLLDMMTNYNLPQHMWRTEVIDDQDVGDSTLGAFGLEDHSVTGVCAWSVYSCMCDGAYTYNDDHPDRSITLEQACRETGCGVELYSQEPGQGFMEHAVYGPEENWMETADDYAEWWPDDDQLVEAGDDDDKLRKILVDEGMPQDMELDEGGRFFVKGGFEKDFTLFDTKIQGDVVKATIDREQNRE